MFLNPSDISARASGVTAPAGAVVGFDGALAEAKALEDWRLCDGRNGAPDLRDRFIIGADDANHVFGETGGALRGAVTGTSGQSGLHGYIDGLTSGPKNAPVFRSWQKGYAGLHGHPLVGDLPPPPSRRLVFIRAGAAGARLPAGAVVWRFDAAAPAAFRAFADLAGRFALGAGDDRRGQVGGDDRRVTLTPGKAGQHVHHAGGDLWAGGHEPSHRNEGNPYGSITSLHAHTGFDTTLSVPKPPYMALLALVAAKETKAPPRIVLAYDGELADLPDTWGPCHGDGGAPDLRGRMALGADGTAAVGAAGGRRAKQPVTGAESLASKTVRHHHNSGNRDSFTHDYSDHSWFNWVHGHDGWTGHVDPMPPWRALHYIISKG